MADNISREEYNIGRKVSWFSDNRSLWQIKVTSLNHEKGKVPIPLGIDGQRLMGCGLPNCGISATLLVPESINHLYAVKTIDELYRAGGETLSFLSYCGGLPAPEASDNSLGYKLPWSSRGVLLALRNDAKFYKDGKIEDVPATELMSSAKPYFIYPGFAFVGYPNRDSTPCKESFNIPEACK